MNLRPAAVLSLALGMFATDVFLAARAKAAEGELEEIVVTARKREENLQSVPISITALGTEALREKQIDTPYDLSYDVPGLVARQTQATRGLVDFTIRGEGSTFGSTPGVIVYFGGVPMKNTGTAGTDGELYDLNSVQVLKGPQGTLFGLSSTGGAVLYDPKKPSDEFGGFVDQQVGNLSYYETTAVINVPIIKNMLNVRAAVDTLQRDGFTQSLGTGQKLDDRNRQSYRLGIDFKPIESVDNYTLLMMNNVNEAASSGVLAAFVPSFPYYNTNLTVAPLAGVTPAAIGAFFSQKFVTGGDTVQEICTGVALASGNLAGVPSCAATRNARLTALVADMTAELARVRGGGSIRKDTTAAHDSINGRNQQIINTTTWKVGQLPFVGDITVKNIFGTNRELASNTIREYGASDLPQGVIYNTYNLVGAPQVPSLQSGPQNTSFGDDIDEELQILGDADGGKLNWIVGYFTERLKNPIVPPPIFLSFNNAFTVPLDSYSFIFPNLTYSKSFQNAFFGQFTQDLSDLLLNGFSITGGVRLTQDGNTTNTWAVIPGVNGLSQGPHTSYTRFWEHAYTWNGSLDYKINPQTLVYLSSRHGFKPGGINGTAAAAQGGNIIYKPETVTDLELGVKADWTMGGVTARTNAAVYNQWLSDAQRSEIVPIGNGGVFTETGNIAAARIGGIEFESQFILSREWMLSLNYNWISARYTAFPGSTTSLNGVVTPNTRTPFIAVPQNQGTFGVRYTLPVNEASIGKVSAYGEFYAQGPMWLDETALALLPEKPGYQGSYQNVNARIDWSSVMGSSIDVGLFGRNVFNKEWIVGSNPNATGLGFVTNTWNQPRTYGLDVRVRFGADGSK
jgi:iron complex outermembrane receptor protein